CDPARRARVEDDRPIRPQTDDARELLARARGSPVEPVVVGRSPGHPHATRGDVVEIHRFAYLLVVPDEHLVGYLPDQALVRQVVPAEDEVAGADTEPLRRSDEFDLGGRDG